MDGPTVLRGDTNVFGYIKWLSEVCHLILIISNCFITFSCILEESIHRKSLKKCLLKTICKFKDLNGVIFSSLGPDDVLFSSISNYILNIQNLLGNHCVISWTNLLPSTLEFTHNPTIWFPIAAVIAGFMLMCFHCRYSQ